MAQEVFFNYQDPLDSPKFNRRRLGVLEPGRYRGFDSMNISTLNFDLVHDSGIEQTKVDLTSTDPVGILYTKQGCEIQEDDVISLSCTTNAANAHIRTDIVVFEHQYVATPGGTPGTYLVIRGTNGTSAAPALTNPTYQIIVGTITIPASASDLSAAVYVPSAVPLLGGENFISKFLPPFDLRYAQLGTTPNIFTTQNREQWGTLATVSSGKLTLNTDGNIFKTIATPYTINEVAAVREGFIVKFFATAAMTINLDATPASGGIPITSVYFAGLGVPITSFIIPSGGYISMVQWGGNFHLLDYSTSVMVKLFEYVAALNLKNPDGIIKKIVNIGDWNMDSTATKSVAHAVADFTKIRVVKILIRNDADNSYLDFTVGNDASYPVPGNFSIDSTNINMLRQSGVMFDGVNFDSTSYNRGYIVIEYIP